MNPLRGYVERRMPLVWKLIMPLNARGIPLDQQCLKRFQLDRLQKKATWKNRATDHFNKLGIGTYDKKLKTVLPIGQKGSLSHAKMKKLLYEEMGLPTQFDVKSKKPTCNKDALRKLAMLDPTGTCDLLRENSLLEEARTALMVTPDPDGRVRTRFVLGGDEKWVEDETGRTSPGSGRLASREPNLQNVPKWVRQIYVPRHPDRWLVRADYSQIEMRLIAKLSGDPELQKAIDTDAHLYIMWLVDQQTDLWGLHAQGFERLFKAYKAHNGPVCAARDETKRIDYGWGYRMGAGKLENIHGIPKDRGKRALAALNAAFPYVVLWWDATVDECRQHSAGTGLGWIANEYGRVRYFAMEDVPAMCNFKPQSLAAEVLFDAMEALEEGLGKLDSELLLTVHDEVVIDTPCADECIPFVREIMERRSPELDLSVPVEITVGKNWADAHEHGPNCKAHCAKPENPNGQKEWSEWN